MTNNPLGITVRYCQLTNTSMLRICVKESCKQEHLTQCDYNKLIYNNEVSLIASKDKNKVKEPLSMEEMRMIFTSWDTFKNTCKLLKQREPNLPEGLTENLTALHLEAKLIISGSGDLLGKNGEIFEVKGSSSPGPNSFSPKSAFDNLIYVYYDANLKTFSVYVLNLAHKDLLDLKMNKNETFQDQANAGRRPRFSIMKEFVIPYGLKSDAVYSFAKML